MGTTVNNVLLVTISFIIDDTFKFKSAKFKFTINTKYTCK